MLYQLPPAVGHTKSDVPPGMLYPGTSQRPADFPCLFGAGIVPPSDDAASSSVPQPINSSPSSHPRLLRRLNVVDRRWREFGNPGRKDTAKMHHWAKKHDTEGEASLPPQSAAGDRLLRRVLFQSIQQIDED